MGKVIGLAKRPTEALRTGILFDVKRFALHDGPGIRTTVFLKGCPLSCFWCHNPESQRAVPELLFWPDRCTGCGTCLSACPRDAISLRGGLAWTDREICDGCGACVAVCPADARAVAGERWSTERVLETVERDVLFYDESGGGVTLSGGEPLAQAEFAASVLSAAKARRIHTAVDTCGYADWKDLDRVGRETDLFLYDVKHLDDGKHRKLTGVSNVRILGNLRRLNDRGQRVWVRYPVIPDVNDAEPEIVALGRLAASLESVEAVHLLPFHRGGERKLVGLGREGRAVSTDADPIARAEKAAAILRGILSVDVCIGG